MGTEKIIESDLEQGSGVSGRKTPERRPVMEEEPERSLSHDEEAAERRPAEPQKPQQPEKAEKSGKKGFNRISFDKKSDSDIFSD